MTTTAYELAWDNLETLRTSLGTPSAYDHSLRLAQAFLAEALGYGDRVEAQRAHDARQAVQS